MGRAWRHECKDLKNVRSELVKQVVDGVVLARLLVGRREELDVSRRSLLVHGDLVFHAVPSTGRNVALLRLPRPRGLANFGDDALERLEAVGKRGLWQAFKYTRGEGRVLVQEFKEDREMCAGRE